MKKIILFVTAISTSISLLNASISIEFSSLDSDQFRVTSAVDSSILNAQTVNVSSGSAVPYSISYAVFNGGSMSPIVGSLDGGFISASINELSLTASTGIFDVKVNDLIVGEATGIFIDSDIGLANDDFGFLASEAFSFSVSPGDTLSVVGTAYFTLPEGNTTGSVFGIGSFVSTNHNNLNIDVDLAPIPEPSSIAFYVSLIAASLVFMRRTRRNRPRLSWA